MLVLCQLLAILPKVGDKCLIGDKTTLLAIKPPDWREDTQNLIVFSPNFAFDNLSAFSKEIERIPPIGDKTTLLAIKPPCWRYCQRLAILSVWEVGHSFYMDRTVHHFLDNSSHTDHMFHRFCKKGHMAWQ